MIRAIPILLAAALVLAASASHAAPPVVSNLVASQREGTKLVDITYDLEVPDAATATVTLRISSDGGATWTVPTTSATGVGAGVEPGVGKAIVWNAGTDWTGRYSEQMRFRVVADDGIPDPAPEGFSLIPDGPFMMGRTSEDEDTWATPPAALTTIGKPYYMAKTETSKGQWDAVRTWASSNGYTDLRVGEGKAADHPVQNIDWWDVVKWCNARSEMEGLTPCYYENAGFSTFGPPFRAGTGVVLVDMEANGYRLPTVAEWERAARGGIEGKRFPWGEDTISHARANYYSMEDLLVPIHYDESLGDEGKFHPDYGPPAAIPYTSPVDSFDENAYGLKNMAGNVSEWCWDNASGWRYYLGGNWNGSAAQCRPAHRPIGVPELIFSHIGFRVVRSTISPTP